MELVKIYKNKLVDARELWEFLEIKSPFNNWATRTIVKHFTKDKDFYAKMHKSTGGRPSKEYYVTINTAKQLAMMAKTAKGEDARNYFIKCEETLKNLAERNIKRVEAFLKLESTKERLLKNIEGIGGTEADYIEIDYKGCQIFFNGEPLPDEELPLILIKGRDFATELTNEQFHDTEIDLDKVDELNSLHHKKVRQMLIENIRKTPESFNPEDDIKKLRE